MSGLSELNSFVGKFVSLWKAGLDANLLVTTHAGEAKLTLEVGLGRAPDQVPPSPYAGKNGPSRQRRKARRAESRRLAEETKVNNEDEDVTTEKVVADNNDEVTEDVSTEKVVAGVNHEENGKMMVVKEVGLSTETVVDEKNDVKDLEVIEVTKVNVEESAEKAEIHDAKNID